MSISDRYGIPRRAFEKGGGDSGASQAAQTSANTQSSALNQIQQLIAQIQGIGSAAGGALTGSGPGTLLNILGLGTNPNALAASTGINAPGIESSSLSALQPFYTNEMKQGINPQFASNAQDQLGQAFAQSLSDIQGNAAPGQNINAKEQAAQDSFLTQSTNLAGNLAGQSQQFSNQGATGLGATANLAQGFNTTDLTSMLQTLAPILTFLSGGNNSALSSLGGVFNTSGQQAENYTNLAEQQSQQQSNAWGSIFSGLLGGGAAAMTGGAAGKGGLGGILTAFSDKRLKKNIKPVGPRVDGLQWYTFRWRSTGESDVGFIAQDVEMSHPEFVGRTRAGIRYVDYGAATRRFLGKLSVAVLGPQLAPA